MIKLLGSQNEESRISEEFTRTIQTLSRDLCSKGTKITLTVGKIHQKTELHLF